MLDISVVEIMKTSFFLIIILLLLKMKVLFCSYRKYYRKINLVCCSHPNQMLGK